MWTMWTDHQTAMLGRLWSEGWSATEIATKIKHETGKAVTRNAVLGRALRLKLPRRADAAYGIRTKGRG